MKISIIKGDGIGPDVVDSAISVLDVAILSVGATSLKYEEIWAGAKYFQETNLDIELNGEKKAANSDAIFLGAIGLPSVRHRDGTEISPHLRLRDQFELYAGIRPIKAYPNSPQRLSDPRARNIDLVILRESTEGLFYSAAIHDRSEIIGDSEVKDTLRITRNTTEKLHKFGFKLAQRRKQLGKSAKLTCVDKANVFASMAFFRKIFDEISVEFPEIETQYEYVDAQALNLVKKPWEYDILVMENMFGDILSDLAGGLVGGMGMAACAEIGDNQGLFQPAHGSAPDIMAQNKANPIAAILSAGMMLDYLAERSGIGKYSEAAQLIENSVMGCFESNKLQPIEFGGEMGTKEITKEILNQLNS